MFTSYIIRCVFNVLATLSALLLALGLTACNPANDSTSLAKDVLGNYSSLAHAAYNDASMTAEILLNRIDALSKQPNAKTLDDARRAWLDARVPYGQTEGFRFGNPVVDDWEPQVNAWPLDEGLIDYVTGTRYDAEQGNEAAKANIIGSDAVNAFGQDISTQEINTELLKSFNELGGSEANVATGYHAIEFLLWGRDFNAKPTDSGQRPASDFDAREGRCTSGDESAETRVCERRVRYLKVASGLLAEDLHEMADQWAADQPDNYRQQLLDLPHEEGLKRMVRGIAALGVAELANQRMRVALLARSQEDEHSCFSDNTHVDIVMNARSIKNIYSGVYTRIDGSKVEGAGLADLVSSSDSSDLNARMQEQLETTTQAVNAVYEAAQNGEHFDQQILDSNPESNKRVLAAIKALETQTDSLLLVASALGISNLNTQID